jgi:hypothetical protein
MNINQINLINLTMSMYGIIPILQVYKVLKKTVLSSFYNTTKWKELFSWKGTTFVGELVVLHLKGEKSLYCESTTFSLKLLIWLIPDKYRLFFLGSYNKETLLKLLDAW